MLELAITCHMAHINIGACHVKRGSNTWADRLADGNFDGFNSAHRRHFDIDDPKNWFIWNELKNRPM